MRPVDLLADETVTFILAHLPAGRLRILEVGCGDGLVANRLQISGHEVVAIDESAEMVHQARALGIDARLAAWPSFEEAPFDIVLFSRSLHHILPLAEAVEQAHRLLVPQGRVIVEDFAWSEIDPATAEWFYSLARLLDRCRVLEPGEDSFVAELMQSGGDFEFWEHSHDHDLNTVSAMWSALRIHFESLHESHAPYLFRYLCPVLSGDETGYAIVQQVLEMEQRLGHLGALTWIGRRFIGVKR